MSLNVTAVYIVENKAILKNLSCNYFFSEESRAIRELCHFVTLDSPLYIDKVLPLFGMLFQTITYSQYLIPWSILLFRAYLSILATKSLTMSTVLSKACFNFSYY